MLITDGFIRKEILEKDATYWVRIRHWKVVEPVEIPAPEVEQELPPEKAAEPVKVAEPVKKAKKVVKHGNRSNSR